jgi:diaminohydroxyphosphoribosylaminopyrimidine deaminase/5-amino-6-(5-phosphoribosylamino)uracil reductase
MPAPFADLESAMRRALALAEEGRGHVEPNPVVGAVLVDDQLQLIAEGSHQKFGEAHAEVNAIAAAGSRAAGSTLLVTLEPCCHHGKTGPCTDAILRAGIKRVIVAMEDPFPPVDGRGIAALRAAGVAVETGLLNEEARRVNAPFIKLVTEGRPWVHAKWAMTADGRIASRTGNSKWISGPDSRQLVHRLRGRMDAIIVGSQTAAEDDPDPLLTARPQGPRVATRIVVDTRAALAESSQLVGTVDQAPLLVAVAENSPKGNISRLTASGAEVLQVPTRRDPSAGRDQIDLSALLSELGRRRMTNVLVEGGSALFGSLFDLQLSSHRESSEAPARFRRSAALDGKSSRNPRQSIR